MSHQRQAPRSMAVFFGLLMSASACSFSENAAFDGVGGGSETHGSDGSTSAQTTSEGGDTGTSDSGGGDETGGEPPQAGPEDPDLDVELCNPNEAQLLAYGLEQANAQAEPVLVRESVLNGPGLVPPIPLSARPFLNHFDFFYPPSESWEPQISGELSLSPMVNGDAPTRYRLQYAVQGPLMYATERLPVDLAIVVDLGALMAGEPVALAEEALAALDAALVPGDRVTLIAAHAQPLLLGTTMIADFGQSPLSGYGELTTEGELGELADVQAALELAYETITPYWDGQGQPRVLLLSNGHFETDADLLGSIDAHAGEGRYLISVGLGEPEQFDGMHLAKLAREGRGAMLYARNPDELWLELEQGFTSHLVAAATDLEVALTLPAGLGVRERDPYIGEKLDPKLAMLGPNEALVFHHELEACDELPMDAVIQVEIDWTDPLSGEAKQLIWEQPVSALSEASLSGKKGAATVAYARALRTIRDGGPEMSYGTVLDAISLISEALAALPEDQELIEMSAVIGKLSG